MANHKKPRFRLITREIRCPPDCNQGEDEKVECNATNRSAQGETLEDGCIASNGKQCNKG